MANLNKVVYLSEAQKNTLFSTGSVTANGTTITYNINDLYITPPSYDTTPTQNSSSLMTSGAIYNAINNAGFLTSYTETDPTVPAWAKATSKPSYTASEVGLGNVTNAAQITKATFTKAYQVMYSTAANTPAVLDANTTATKKFLRMTGTGSAGAAPAWDTVTKSDVGLGNVENTALSTWAGSSNITTIGTLSSGTVPWARLSNVPAGASKEGTVTSITPGNGLLNGTGTSAITNTGTLNINYGSSASAVSTTVNAGSANTVSRSDHVHSISLATGDSNGQIKIAGTNVSVKGLGSAAYTESSTYAASSHTHYWANITTTTAAAYNTAPEMATLKLNGNTSASAASTSNVTLVFDATLQALNFVFT